MHEHAELKRAAEGVDGEPPKKRPRLRGVQGVHARDMSLVTPENVATRGGWRVTQTGRIIRPMRMRPSHPLPELVVGAQPSTKSNEKGKGKSDKGESRRRVRDPPTRVRRKTIDPTKYGSQHLKGIFLENAAAYAPPAPLRSAIVPGKALPEGVDGSMPSSSLGSEDDSEEEDSSSDKSEEDVPRSSATPVAKLPVVAPSPPQSTLSVPMRTAEPSTTSQDLAEEKTQSLGVLQSLFGDAEDWGGAESVGSDVEIGDERALSERAPSRQSSVDEVDVDVDLAMEVDEPLMEEAISTTSAVPDGERANGVQKTKLKDLFAPREEEGIRPPVLLICDMLMYISSSWLLPARPSRPRPGA